MPEGTHHDRATGSEGLIAEVRRLERRVSATEARLSGARLDVSGLVGQATTFTANNKATKVLASGSVNTRSKPIVVCVRMLSGCLTDGIDGSIRVVVHRGGATTEAGRQHWMANRVQAFGAQLPSDFFVFACDTPSTAGEARIEVLADVNPDQVIGVTEVNVSFVVAHVVTLDL